MAAETPTPRVDGFHLMPFVACQSQGGPYDDQPFMAGYTAGRLDAALQVAATLCAGRIDTVLQEEALIPQMHLIALRHGYVLTTEPIDDAPTGMVSATFILDEAAE